VSPASLIAQRNALVALVRTLMQDRTGGVLTSALEMLVRLLKLQGGLAYRIEEGKLALVADMGVPHKARAWLALLPIDGDGWFVAQRVARAIKSEIDGQVAPERFGSIRPTLQEAGWGALAAAPVAVGRSLQGVLVVAGKTADAFDKEAMEFLETMGGALALALERETTLAQAREDRVRETKTTQLATMGLLAAAVARDLATPLGALQLQVETQEQSLKELRAELVASLGEEPTAAIVQLDELEQLAAELGDGLRKAQSLASRLLALSRESKSEPVDLSRIAASVRSLMQSTVGARGIELQALGDDNIAVVDGREESLYMLVTQLMLFAVQECEGSREGDKRVVMTLEPHADRHVLIVESSGRGAKTSGKPIEGLLGRGSEAAVFLELAKQTVLLHKGHIEVGTSQLGGTLLRVVLPASQAVPRRDRRTPAERPSPLPTDPARKAFVLVVDDDAPFVRGLVRALAPHKVVAATSVAEARRRLAMVDPRPDLVLCDVNLPDGLGTEVHATSEPDMAARFVFVTGAVLPEEVAAYLKASGCPTLIKPITIDEVLRMLSEADMFQRASQTLAPPATPKPAGDDLERPTIPEPLSMRRVLDEIERLDKPDMPRRDDEKK
jgi:signal transduction histidine kinase/ActR/RegA family two-component response regulator